MQPQRRSSYKSDIKISTRCSSNVDIQTNLMIDHGLLKRVLIALENLTQNHHQEEKPTSQVLDLICRCIRIFSEYIHPVHEEAEEKYIFPQCIRFGFEAEMVNQLWNQHNLIKEIIQHLSFLVCSLGSISMQDWNQICKLTGFLIRIYEYHEAIEDTIIFPGFYHVCQFSPEMQLQRSLFSDYIDKETKKKFKWALKEIQAVEKRMKISLNTVTPTSSELDFYGIHFQPKNHILQ